MMTTGSGEGVGAAGEASDDPDSASGRRVGRLRTDRLIGDQPCSAVAAGRGVSLR